MKEQNLMILYFLFKVCSWKEKIYILKGIIYSLDKYYEKGRDILCLRVDEDDMC